MMSRRLALLIALLMLSALGCQLTEQAAPPKFLPLPPLDVAAEALPASPTPSATAAPDEIEEEPPPTVDLPPPPLPTHVEADAPTEHTCVPPNGRDGWVPYVVQPANTQFSLARSTGTSVEEVQQANCLSGTLIIAGQPLYLPSIPVVTPTEAPKPESNPPPPAPTEDPPVPPPPPEPTVDVPPAPPPPPESTVDVPPPPLPGDPRIIVEPGSGPAGTTFTFKVRDFDPLEVVTIRIEAADGTEVETFSVAMDANGKRDVQWQSPGDLAAGGYRVFPFGSDGTPGNFGTLVIE